MSKQIKLHYHIMVILMQKLWNNGSNPYIITNYT